jgi:uncharacterized membrane protein YphA (DoxX/SURF4 family)
MSRMQTSIAALAPRTAGRANLPSPAARAADLTPARSLACWALQLAVAAILGQTLFFKFTASPESVAIFTRLGAEPWGRIASGIAELAAAILLVVPGTALAGAILAAGIISGAIASHLTVLGIAVANSDGRSDGGLLFGLALAVLAGSIAIVALRRAELRRVLRRISTSR